MQLYIRAFGQLARSAAQMREMAVIRVVSRIQNGGSKQLDLPDAHQEVLPGIRWGRPDKLFTPAYWASQLWLRGEGDSECTQVYRLGNSLREEAAACLLGGYGIPAEVGLAAFHAVQKSGLLATKYPTAAEVSRILQQPLQVGAHSVRYRFVRQKSEYLSELLAGLGLEIHHTSASWADRELRDWLLRFRGIGPKTASWITRNWRASDAVAIIDIHVYRAGLYMGLFAPTVTPSTHYFTLEARYLQFAHAIGAQPSALDALIWQHMRILSRQMRQSKVM